MGAGGDVEFHRWKVAGVGPQASSGAEPASVNGVEQQFPEVCIVFGVCKVVLREAVDSRSVPVGVHHVKVAPCGLPVLPDRAFCVVLEQGEGCCIEGCGVAALVATFVDGEQRDGRVRVVGFEFVLKVLEVAKLATAVASRRVDEVPTRHLTEVVPRRKCVSEARRVRVEVFQKEVGDLLSQWSSLLRGARSEENGEADG